MIQTVRSCSFIFATFCTLSCYSWRSVGLGENPDAATRPADIEIRVKNGIPQTVYSPIVRGDSLHGWLEKDRQTPAAFAVTDITSARSLQINGGRTMILAVGLVVLSAALLLMIALANADWPPF